MPNPKITARGRPPKAVREQSERHAVKLAARMLVVGDVRNEQFDEITVKNLVPLFPEWTPELSVSVGEVYAYDGYLVEVVQSHTTQADWTPDVTPALWKKYFQPEEGPQPWVQPTGAHDAYPDGAKVIHNGQLWINTHGNGNNWEPGVYGWEALEEEVPDPDPDPTDPSGPDPVDPTDPDPDPGYPAWQIWDGYNESLYQVGDRVSHNGENWEATAGNNHWEPGVFGWEII